MRPAYHARNLRVDKQPHRTSGNGESPCPRNLQNRERLREELPSGSRSPPPIHCRLEADREMVKSIYLPRKILAATSSDSSTLGEGSNPSQASAGLMWPRYTGAVTRRHEGTTADGTNRSGGKIKLPATGLDPSSGCQQQQPRTTCTIVPVTPWEMKKKSRQLNRKEWTIGHRMWQECC